MTPRPLISTLFPYTTLFRSNYETQRLARIAIHEIGPAAVPFLTNSLAQRNAISIRMYRKNFLPRKIASWSHRVIKWQTPMMESRNAAIALQALGAPASNAIAAFRLSIIGVCHLITR